MRGWNSSWRRKKLRYRGCPQPPALLLPQEPFNTNVSLVFPQDPPESLRWALSGCVPAWGCDPRPRGDPRSPSPRPTAAHPTARSRLQSRSHQRPLTADFIPIIQPSSCSSSDGLSTGPAGPQAAPRGLAWHGGANRLLPGWEGWPLGV